MSAEGAAKGKIFTVLAVCRFDHHVPPVRTGSESTGAPRAKEGNRSLVLLFLQRWAINTLAVLVATNIVPGIDYDRNNLASLFVASLLFGILITFLRPLLLLLTLPIVVVTLGLFMLVINAGLLYLVGSLVKGFHVAGFWPAFWGALVISVVSLVLNTLTGSGDNRVRVRRSTNGNKPSGGGDNGPVIDV